jgi:putative phosphoribosyl transferase
MIAAIEMVKKLEPRKIVVAVPCSPKDTLNKVGPMVDELICLEVQEYGSFAVASYYREFPDMTDEEVLSYLG